MDDWSGGSVRADEAIRSGGERLTDAVEAWKDGGEAAGKIDGLLVEGSAEDVVGVVGAGQGFIGSKEFNACG